MGSALIAVENCALRRSVRDRLRHAEAPFRCFARASAAIRRLAGLDVDAAVVDAPSLNTELIPMLMERGAALFVAVSDESPVDCALLPHCSVIIRSGHEDDIADKVRAALQAATMTGGADREAVGRRLQSVAKRGRDLQAELEAKGRFLANVSHELRTPLTSIREFASLTLDEVAGPVTGDQREFLTTIISNVDHLGLIIQDLLLISEMEEEGPRLVLGPLDVRKAVRRALDQTVSGKSGRAEVTVDLPDDLPMALADETRIVQVLTNLLSNALKFTPADGRVRVSAEVKSTTVEVSVQDTGRGIPPEDLPHVFERFYQVADPNGPSRKGTGLGLNIVKAIVESHGGEVRAVSTLTSGSTFCFTLPIFSVGAWLQDSQEPGAGPRAPIVITVRMTPTARGRYPAREDLEQVAELLKRPLRRDDRLVTAPAAGSVYVLVQGRRNQGLAVRDRLAQVIHACTDPGLREFGFEIGLEDAPESSGQQRRAAA